MTVAVLKQALGTSIDGQRQCITSRHDQAQTRSHGLWGGYFPNITAARTAVEIAARYQGPFTCTLDEGSAHPRNRNVTCTPERSGDSKIRLFNRSVRPGGYIRFEVGEGGGHKGYVRWHQDDETQMEYWNPEIVTCSRPPAGQPPCGYQYAREREQGDKVQICTGDLYR